MIMCIADVFSLVRAIRRVLIYVSMLNTGVVKGSSVGDVPFLYATCRTGFGSFVSCCNRKDCVTGTTGITLGETLSEEVL
jgi:hypothetical protein